MLVAISKDASLRKSVDEGKLQPLHETASEFRELAACEDASSVAGE
jgi:hypothetical protein